MMTSKRVSLPSGLTLSRTIPGLMRLRSWDMSQYELIAWIEGCLAMGATSFDHADIYGGYRCEGIFGEALAASPALRGQLEIVTKCGIALLSDNRPYTVHHYITTRQHIIASAEQSLRHFHTDHLDLLLIHRPDPLMDADEVAGALEELRQSGKILHAGVSNFTPFQWDLLQSRLSFPLATNQVEISLLYMNTLHDGTLDQAQRLRTPPMAWSPVAGGWLFSAVDARAVRVRGVLDRVAAAHDSTPEHIALAWVMQHPSKPMPVTGTGKLERVRVSIEAENITLSREEWFALWEASNGAEVP